MPGRSLSLGAVARAEDDRLPARSQILTAETELRSMFLIEPERGCSRGCTYCVMRRTTNGGMRTVPPERVLELVPDQARRVGLVGAAVTDHPRVVELVRALVDGGREVGISSLRADRLTDNLVKALKDGGAPLAHHRRRWGLRAHAAGHRSQDSPPRRSLGPRSSRASTASPTSSST